MKDKFVKSPMKTVSARLPEDDVELFQLICEEYHLTQSEVIRQLIQTFISQTFEVEPQSKEYSVHDFEAYQKQKEIEKFYESFRKMNKEKIRGTMLKIGNM
ncbi:metal-responsive CopG/Arc/MetJ family transcriptional regulator [Caldalkalibacillus uzonensis]|uniref:Metal-responsive CopG/Arc/MetJ family transcriptional regulator n=1 Tax=Caldalkalibacillus uzonensis TaxID=353224 RepID=A0ABU0CNY9_9BACI|nr:ribbon-helix-helix domain-containing protein [Caldalkalibacillus uzonensis]MDQ0338126.1 metal-responsive CopG/Arc/MetJ family transcriptional regulator [Caldalkalibacillus uzonensis]